MGIFSGLVKIAIAPIAAVAEVARDISGENGEDSQGAAILTMGLSSVVKGAAKSVVEGVDDVLNS